MAGLGCITSAGGELASIEPQPPARPPVVEHSVGSFSVQIDGGIGVSPEQMAVDLNEQILSRWRERGYIADFQHAPRGDWSGRGEYQVALSGSETGESSIAMLVLSVLTVFVIPNWTNTRYEVQYTLRDAHSGELYHAAASDRYTTVMQLLLAFAAPYRDLGWDATVDRIADHLYQQLRNAGAFE